MLFSRNKLTLANHQPWPRDMEEGQQGLVMIHEQEEQAGQRETWLRFLIILLV